MRRQVDHVEAEAIRTGLARVRERVQLAAERSGRSAGDVQVVAAVKYLDDEACATFAAEGVVDLAENRLERLEARLASPEVPDDVRWHFIGRLQSRDAADVARHSHAIHSLCTGSAARRLAAGSARPELFVQVNVDRDPAKDGLDPDAVEQFLLGLPPELGVAGLMAMPAATDDPEGSRTAFAALRELRDRLAPLLAGRHRLESLSMGTSQDHVVAIEEGATHVRLGRTLYAGTE